MILKRNVDMSHSIFPMAYRYYMVLTPCGCHFWHWVLWEAVSLQPQIQFQKEPENAGLYSGGCCSDTAKGIEFHTQTHAQELSRLCGIFSGSGVPTTSMMSCTVSVLMKFSFWPHPRQYLSLVFIFCQMIRAYLWRFSFFSFSYKSSASM